MRARGLRHEVLRRTDPPRYTALLAEAACDAGDTPPQVWREQVGHLVELATLPHVTIRLLPRGVAARGGRSRSRRTPATRSPTRPTRAP